MYEAAPRSSSLSASDCLLADMFDRRHFRVQPMRSSQALLRLAGGASAKTNEGKVPVMPKLRAGIHWLFSLLFFRLITSSYHLCQVTPPSFRSQPPSGMARFWQRGIYCCPSKCSFSDAIAILQPYGSYSSTLFFSLLRAIASFRFRCWYQ